MRDIEGHSGVKIQEYAKRLLQEVSDLAERDAIERVDAFTEVAVERLIDAGEMEGCVISSFSDKTCALSGWGFEDEEQHLHLVIADFRGGDRSALTAAQVNFAFNGLTAFVERALEGRTASLPYGVVADAAETIATRWSTLQSASFYLVTDAVASRQTIRTPVNVGGVDVTRHVWDLGRLHRLEMSGVDREPITVDLEEIYGEPIPCIAGPEAEDHTVYLALIPGEVLAEVYNQHGPRLLERNVRSFLQARGAVNKGIRETILESPSRFLAYNNGISATAAEIELVELEGGNLAISALHDLQIVNGGQTTASIATAVKKDLADVTGIAVQAKITVVDSTVIDELVRHISQYSNTQNKVTGADFSANDRFHRAIERFSTEIRTPQTAPNAGTFWYYERARGRYVDELERKKSAAEKKRFRSTFPAKQKFSKLDLAKFEHSWEQLPHFVSLGAEKNFREFTLRLNDRSVKPDEGYFRRLVAKAILFRAAEGIVSGLGFGGFRANIVTYTMAKLVHATAHRLDLEAIWGAQEVSPAIEAAIAELAPQVNEAIRNPRGRVSNPTEWAKKKELWDIVRDIEWDMPPALEKSLIPLRSGGGHLMASDEVVDRGISTPTTDETNLINEVASVASDVWFRLSNWAKETNNLQPWQRSLAYSLGGLATKQRLPSIKQATQGSKMLAQARSLGFS